MRGKADRSLKAPNAFVLCGGKGLRLRSVVSDRPKSMAPISGTPFLQLLIEKLRREGITDVILGTGYMAENVRDHFGDGTNFDVRIRYSTEDEALGTGGALKLAEPLIGNPVLVLNGDSYLEWSLNRMLELFYAKDATVVIAAQAVSDVSRYGSMVLDGDGRVTEFVEKEVCAGPGLINGGVYLLRKEVVRELPAAKAISLERDIFPTLLNRQVYGLVCTGLFIDIGIPGDFRRAQTLLASLVRNSP